jgi:CTP synthase
MNPVEHGEVFVLDDGTEVDMDFGHYERFLNVTCTGRQNLTMGKVFSELRDLEREGAFLGKTVQMVPHASNHILKWWEDLLAEDEIGLIEIGGTVGDMENELYLEAARQLRLKHGKENVMFVHLTYVPIPGGVDEQKSKPTQQSVRQLMERGLHPDIILCRCQEKITEPIRNKIAQFSNINTEQVISAIDVDNVYKIPLVFYDQGILDIVQKQLGLVAKPDLELWKKLVQPVPKDAPVTIALCGKYTALEDSYASVIEALNHASVHNDVQVQVRWIDTQHVEEHPDNLAQQLEGVHGVIVPGGFGSRGIEGKIKVIEHCRTHDIPYLGICYGLQLAVVEFARNVCGIADAQTTEINPKSLSPVIDYLPDKRGVTTMGGTLRLGAYPAELDSASTIYGLYKETKVSERHRHRYEVNPEFHKTLSGKDLVFCGMSPDKRLVEFIELDNHPYFVATQAHPELKSTLEKPAPLFDGLVAAAKVLRGEVPSEVVVQEK